MLKRIKRFRSHTDHARFLAEIDEDNGFDVGWIPRQTDIPSPYAWSEEWPVHEWNGLYVTIRETSHRCYDVFEVPEQMVRNDDPIISEQETNYLRGLGI